MALANPASSRSSTLDVRRTRDPTISPPLRIERVLKAPGSKKLVLGKWVEVMPGDPDCDK